jgi:glycosyltransferase involved in cell wall biosynthesis
VGFLHGGVNLDRLESSSAVLHRVKNLGNMDPFIVLRLLALVRSYRPDIVQTWLTQMDVLGGLAAGICGVPVILSERASAAAYSHAWRDRLRMWIGRRATAIVANSAIGLDYWRALGTRGKLLMVRNGVPLDRIRKVVPANLANLGLMPEARLILFAGRLVDPQKNIPLLLDAIDQVMGVDPDVVALLCGEGPLRASVEMRIDQSPHSNRFRLLGFSDNLWGWMRKADVLVSVSRFEGNPNVVLEAMGVGCPLVVSDIPEHREILNETMARFCTVDAVNEMASAILDVLNSRSAARERVEAARKRVAGWTVDESARQYLDIYTKVVQGAGIQQ